MRFLLVANFLLLLEKKRFISSSFSLFFRFWRCSDQSRFRIFERVAAIAIARERNISRSRPYFGAKGVWKAREPHKVFKRLKKLERRERRRFRNLLQSNSIEAAKGLLEAFV